MTERNTQIINLINKEVKPALGCTEPIAVALAAVKAVETLEDCCRFSRNWRARADFEITVQVSANILKNGMGVGIPGVGMTGLQIAAALGAVCGKSEYGLEVLHDLDPESISRAKQLVGDGRIHIELARTDKKLYIRAAVRALIDGRAHEADAVIENDHDNIVETRFDDRILQTAGPATATPAQTKAAISAQDKAETQGGTQDRTQTATPAQTEAGAQTQTAGTPDGLTVREILDFATTVPYSDISFILESRRLNLALAREGLSGDYGLKVGKTIMDSEHKDVFGDDFISFAMAMTAAATDARMAGCTLPAMSNSGSGNQGITATMPVIAYALRNDIPDETLARALILSHLIAIHIKSYLGKLSALCGCVVASTGSSCGLVYLKGGGYDQICSTIKNMIGNIMGMVCDGAKCGCALKVASGVSGSIQSAVLAMDGICISENDGIIDRDIERTIANLGRIGSVGMQTADDMILDIMVCK